MPSSYTCGDILHVNFPMAEGDSAMGQPRFKARPALVVTDADSNGDFVMVAVTSKAHHAYCTELHASDLANGQLRHTSYVRADKLFSVNTQAVQAKLAVAKPDLVARVRKLLCPAVGCK